MTIESEEFYNVCQTYRHASDNGDACKAYEALIKFIDSALLSVEADNARLREALECAQESLLRFTSDEGSTQKDFDTVDHVHHALSIESPFTALQEYRNSVIEECAKLIEWTVWKTITIKSCVKKIKNLKQ